MTFADKEYCKVLYSDSKFCIQCLSVPSASISSNFCAVVPSVWCLSPRALPFALIDAVSAGSPAEQDGLRVGDYLVAFGSVKGQTGAAAVAAVARELQESEGRSVRVTVLRAGRPQTLSVVPRTWNGRGLLGYVVCHLLPFTMQPCRFGVLPYCKVPRVCRFS